jgi:hypothetical protein
LNLFLVTFSLRNSLKDYNPFFVALRGNAFQWWHFIEQSCVVTTSHDLNSYVQQLLPHIENSDSLLVVEITPHQFQGWLPQQAWDWLIQASDQKKLQGSPLTFLLPPSK